MAKIRNNPHAAKTISAAHRFFLLLLHQNCGLMASLYKKTPQMDQNTPYIVSARKYRPANFHTVVGQKALTETLRNAVTTGRVAQAYLFCGPRGVGKTSCARIFAKTLNCQHLTPEGEACGECESCKAVDRGNSFNLLELDAASNNSVNDIRDITDQVSIPPQNGRYRVFIIDEVHMLSSAAFNAFLKTLEEPPRHVVFILATTEKHKILPTIMSRCQVYDFKRITVNDMVEHLAYVASQEGISAQPEALDVIARKADGAMRDALSIFDQVAASCMGDITYAGTVENLNVLDYEYYFRIVEAFCKADVASALLLYNEIRDKGFDSLFFVNGLAAHLRNLMVAADPRTIKLLEVSSSVGPRYIAQAASLPPQWYYHALAILNECDVNYRSASSKQLLVELSLVRIASLRSPQTTQQPQAPTPQQTPVAPAPAPPKQQPPAAGTQQPPRQAHPQPPVQQPRPAHNPAVQQRTEAAPRPVGKIQLGSGAPATVRIRQGNSQTPDSLPNSQGGGQKGAAAARHTPITPDRLADAWQQFIAANPQLTIVVTTMQTSVPEKLDETTYRLELANEGQRQQFEKAMPTITGFIRDRLENDDFTLRLALSQNREQTRILTTREFITNVMTNNPSLRDLLTFLDAELI